uniref:Uncharacterized protein n=1 Tax=Picea sitchensis TaxID=3332 RepID=D5A8P8_PICSI|nr:unknown [Picea sitchensis]
MVISGHVPDLEVIGRVAEVADLAWNAFERHHERKESVTIHERCLKLEEELALQRSENERLKAELEEFCKSVQDFKQLHNSSQSSCGDALAGGCQYSELENCPSDLYERLRNTVDSPNFLAKLKTSHDNGSATSKDPANMGIEVDTLANTNPEDPSLWVWVPDDMATRKVEERCGLDNEGYILITEEDLVDGIATFVASFIVSNSQAKKMTPEQLQKVLSNVLESMHRRNTIKKLWDTSKFMYTAATWGITLIGFYRNPFLLKAAMKAVLFTGRILVKAL